MSSKEKEIDSTETKEIANFWKTKTLICKTHSKITYFMKICNDPTVIADILPQAVLDKTTTTVQLLTEVLKFIYPNSGTHFRDNIR